jgi:hypothetical protein
VLRTLYPLDCLISSVCEQHQVFQEHREGMQGRNRALCLDNNNVYNCTAMHWRQGYYVRIRHMTGCGLQGSTFGSNCFGLCLAWGNAYIEGEILHWALHLLDLHNYACIEQFRRGNTIHNLRDVEDLQIDRHTSRRGRDTINKKQVREHVS